MKITGFSNEGHLLKCMGNLEGMRVVDVGGGTGTLAKAMYDRYAEVTIIDPSTPMTQIALKKCPELKIINTTAESIPVENNYFDVVCIRDCFHHINCKIESLKEVTRILKPGGQIAIQEFDPGSLISKIIYVFERSLGEKIVLVKPSEMVQMMSHFGIHGKITNVSRFEYVFSGVKK